MVPPGTAPLAGEGGFEGVDTISLSTREARDALRSSWMRSVADVAALSPGLWRFHNKAPAVSPLAKSPYFTDAHDFWAG